MTADELTEEVLCYVLDNSDAADTVEGIAAWWVRRKGIADNLHEVKNVIGALHSQGILIEKQVNDSHTVYLLDKARRGEALDMLKRISQQQKPGSSET